MTVSLWIRETRGDKRAYRKTNRKRFDGNLYGVTLDGGLSRRSGGTIFKMSLSGAFSTLWLFNGQTGGSNTSPGLAVAANGDLYGMYSAYLEGQPECGEGPCPGGILQIDQSGTVSFPASFFTYPFSCPAVMTPDGTLFALCQASLNGQTLESVANGANSANIAMCLPTYYANEFVNFFGGMMLATDGRFYVNGTDAGSVARPYVELQLDPAAR